MNPKSIAAQEIADIYRQAIRGEIIVSCTDGITWDQVRDGAVEFLFGVWRIAIYNDCDQIDYTEFAVSPDNRHANFDDWCIELKSIGCPLQLLTDREVTALESIIHNAR